MEPRRAAVVPRAFAPESGEALPLEDLVAPHLDGDAPGAVAVLGPPGSGKSTALAHLASRWPRVPFLDEDGSEELTSRAAQGPVVYAAEAPSSRIPHLARLRLAPWTGDEVLEYLLAKHRDRCASVMGRLRAAPDRGIPDGLPELWTAVLDVMAADESVTGVSQAFRASFGADADRASAIALDARRSLGRSRFRRLLRHRPVQTALAASEMLGRLRGGGDARFLARILPDDLVAAFGPHARGDATVEASLLRALADPERQPNAASLLHAAGFAFQPPPRANLARSRLAGVAWPGIDLGGAELRGADLARANLHGASLLDVEAQRANLSGADLSSARATGACFDGADLSRADLRGALLREAHLKEASLLRTDLSRADLTDASLVDARLDHTNLSGACLDGADLTRLVLRRAALAGATLRGATLAGVRMAGVHLPGAALERAILLHADLTGAHLPDARLRDAQLCGCRLAHVCLERADLRGADLRRADFHMGSSRSGLVGSPIACEGSRTGFYTDEKDEMHFKAPEEIRKANLRGADLRGARVDKTDFYLVDLRDATYDARQAAHFRRCGAILAARV